MYFIFYSRNLFLSCSLCLWVRLKHSTEQKAKFWLELLFHFCCIQLLMNTFALLLFFGVGFWYSSLCVAKKLISFYPFLVFETVSNMIPIGMHCAKPNAFSKTHSQWWNGRQTATFYIPLTFWIVFSSVSDCVELWFLPWAHSVMPSLSMEFKRSEIKETAKKKSCETDVF